MTAQLSATSTLLMVLTMFVGRLGPMTVAGALIVRYHAADYHLPRERLGSG